MKSSKEDQHLLAASSGRLNDAESSKTDKTNPDVEESASPSSSSEQETLAYSDRRANHRKARPLQNESALNDAMLQFAVDVYLELRRGTGEAGSNVLFSPLAVQTMMALMLAVANGRTADQLAQALHLNWNRLGSSAVQVQRSTKATIAVQWYRTCKRPLAT